MKLFKLFLLLPLALLFITSCGGDDDGGGPDLTGNFPGTYTGTISFDSGVLTQQDVSLKIDKVNNSTVQVSFTTASTGAVSFDANVGLGVLTGIDPVSIPDDGDYVATGSRLGGKLNISLVDADDPSSNIVFTEN